MWAWKAAREAHIRWLLHSPPGKKPHKKLGHVEHLLRSVCVFDRASKQTQVLVPAGSGALFPDQVHCQVPLLCAALSWAPRRPLSSLTLSLAKVQCGWLCLFTSLIHSHYLIATWSHYMLIHLRARQLVNWSGGWRADSSVKGAAMAQLPLIFA